MATANFETSTLRENPAILMDNPREKRHVAGWTAEYDNSNTGRPG